MPNLYVVHLILLGTYETAKQYINKKCSILKCIIFVVRDGVTRWPHIMAA